MANLIDLKGRKAVVTGGQGGIGSAICKHLATGGAEVAIWDRVSGPQDGPGCLSLVVDITEEGSVAEALERTRTAFSRIDILVTAAGATGPALPTQDYSLTDWNRVLTLNLTGAFLPCRAVLPLMRDQNYGRIVNIASIAGKEGNQNLAAYSAAKAGVIALTKVMAKETAELDIKINAIAPGLVRTRLLDEMTEEAIRWSLEKIPMKRAGTTDEIAALTAWAASEECSFTTGAVFDVSGGRASY